MKKVLIILSVLPIFLQAQIQFQKEYTHPSLNFLGSFADLVENDDSTYMGVLFSVNDINRDQKIRVVKLDKLGKVLIDKEFKAKGFDSRPYKIYKDNRNYFIVGEYYVRDSILITRKSFVLKINERGDSLWLKDYHLTPIWTSLYGIILLKDNNFLLSGHTTSFKKVGTDYKEQPWNIALIKIDSLGNVIWQKEIVEYKYALGLTSNAIVELPNEDFLIAGRSVSYSAGENHDIAPIVLRVDKNGNLKWLKRYGELGKDDAFIKMTATKDNKFLLSGGYNIPPTTNFRGSFFMKVDENGDIIWKKNYQSEIESMSFYGGHTQNIDGTITTSGVVIKDFTMGIAQFDSTGNFKWFRKYDIHPQSDEIMNGIISTLDGGFAFFGHGKSKIRQNDQAFLFKVDGYGCLQKGCQGSIAVDDVPKEETEATSLSIAPNPNNGIATISWNIADEAMIKGRIEVIDMLGQIIQVIDIQQLEGKQNLDMSGVAAGMYFLKLKMKDKELVKKFIVIH
jgi:hypothetical protein